MADIYPLTQGNTRLQIKKLQLAGFKTFADKTEIEFSDGLTAVVGPNGSGKSNVADALLWVMGEQNPRLMRGNDSRDVIFAGTDRRKPLGMAEVKLTLDNFDKSLALDFGEITVTRRIYRSGESQYLLNGAPCRMKDIVELFLDTGIGKGAYSFVSQSEIDSVLSARPEDRRELFEEAAGIKKYRVRKREAVRKLDQAENNLNRIRDIAHELEQQRAPLEAQAEQAKRFLQLTDRLQQIEVGMLVAEVRKADYELYASRQQQDLDREAIGQIETELGRMEREAEGVVEQLAAAEKELDAARMAQQGALTTTERTESRLHLTAERERSADAASARLDEELQELKNRISALRHEIDAERVALEKSDKDEASKRDQLVAAKTRLVELEKALAQTVRRSEDRQGALRQLAEQRARRESALAACQSRLADVETRIARLHEESKLIAAQQAEAAAKVEQLKVSVDELTQQQTLLQKLLAEKETERRKALDAQGAAAISLDAARRLLAERSSRLSTLTELQEAGEGFFQGVRAALKAYRDKKLVGRYAAVVDLLDVPENLRVAIEITLGSSLQDIVCDTEEEARDAIQWLKRERAGRATFLPLPLLRPDRLMSKEDLKGMQGLLGIASERVNIDPHYDVVRKLLLGRVILAEDMDSALRAARRLDGWHRIVTLEGELVTPHGSMTGGSLSGRGAHLVGRKGEIDDLKRAMPELRQTVEKHTAEAESARVRAAELDGEIAAIRNDNSDCAAMIASAESNHKSALRESERLESVRCENEAEVNRQYDGHGKLTEEAKKWADAVETGRAEDTSADDAIAEAQQEAKRLATERDNARRTTVALEVETGRLAEKRSGLKRSLLSREQVLAQSVSEQTARQNLREQSASQLAEASTMQRVLRDELETAKIRLGECRVLFDTWQEKRKSLLNDSFQRRSLIKELTEQRTTTVQSLHDAELQIARLEVRLAQNAARLLDEYGITQEEALAREDAPEPGRETVNEIARLRREVRQMGQVNTGAVEEYQRLTERHAFLCEQRDDLEKARTSLLETIAEIDDSTREAFMQTFHAVSTEFSRIFHQLFGGGTTRLTLTNPDDLLETGIDVIAQPPGKKPQHLSLLSGGERALTATALLFSFLAVRPSPFVLLDEVDAPLDGPNVEKFVSLVREFSEKTQFLVITHNPTTMEAAPRWYGVTMQEPGVSRVLSYMVPQDAIASEVEEEIVLQENLPL